MGKRCPRTQKHTHVGRTVESRDTSGKGRKQLRLYLGTTLGNEREGAKGSVYSRLGSELEGRGEEGREARQVGRWGVGRGSELPFRNQGASAEEDIKTTLGQRISLRLEILPLLAVFAQSQEALYLAHALPGSQAIPGLGTVPKPSFLLGPKSKTRGI